MSTPSSARSTFTFCPASNGLRGDIGGSLENDSYVSTPDNSGLFSKTHFSDESGRVVNNGDGFAYAAGVDKGGTRSSDRCVVIAGIIPTSRVSELPTSGTVTMSGEVEPAGIYNIRELTSTYTTADIYKDTGVIDLTADFGAGTLKGSSGNLTVN